jgi:hypothetical protein
MTQQLLTFTEEVSNDFMAEKRNCRIGKSEYFLHHQAGRTFTHDIIVKDESPIVNCFKCFALFLKQVGMLFPG